MAEGVMWNARARMARVVMIASVFALGAGCADSAQPVKPPITAQPSQADLGPGPDQAPPEQALETYTLRQPVEILTDEHGIPHVYASDDLDLFYGAGYQLAKERLFDLDINRRAAVGTRAEVFGPSKIGADVQAKVLRWGLDGELSAQVMAAERTEDYNLLVAYSAGINAYISEVLRGEQPLPEGYGRHDFLPTALSPAQLLAIGMRINFSYSSQLEFDLLNTLLHKLKPTKASSVAVHKPGSDTFTMRWFEPPNALKRPAPPAPAPSLEGDEAAPLRLSEAQRQEIKRFTEALHDYRLDLRVGEGSNAWIIAGEHSFNGRPIVANDSHASLNDPNALYLMHMNSRDAGGRFDVMGFGFVGIPGVQLGHNHKLAWAATTHFADMMDIWEVNLRPQDTTLSFGQKVYPVVRRTARFKVRGQAEQVVELVEIPGVGVILPESFLPVPKLLLTRKELLLGYPGFRGTDELSMFLGLDRAETLEAFGEAIDIQRVGMQNWHGATATGFEYRTSGQVPDRGVLAEGVAPTKIMDGTKPETAWTGAVLPAERLPRLGDELPFHFTANNDPWGHTQDNDPLNDAFYYGGFYAPGYRAGRLLEALREQTQQGSVSVEQTQALQLEVTSQVSPALIPLLEAAAQEIAMTPELERFTHIVDESTMARQCKPALCDAVARLAAWDHQMSPDSSEALLFRVWLAYLSRLTLVDDLDALLFDVIDAEQPVTTVKMTARAYLDGVTTLIGQTPSVTMLEALELALEAISARGLTSWGELHRARFITADDRVLLLEPVGGDDTSLNVSQSRCWAEDAQGDPIIAQHCTATVGAVFRTVTTFEEDGTPKTVFNFAKGNGVPQSDWVEGRYKPWLFRTQEVRASAGTRIVRLTPQ